MTGCIPVHNDFLSVQLHVLGLQRRESGLEIPNRSDRKGEPKYRRIDPELRQNYHRADERDGENNNKKGNAEEPMWPNRLATIRTTHIGHQQAGNWNRSLCAGWANSM